MKINRTFRPQGGRIHVAGPSPYLGVIRPNKNAAGQTYTAHRKGKNKWNPEKPIDSATGEIWIPGIRAPVKTPIKTRSQAHRDDVLKLAVRGSMDALARGINYFAKFEDAGRCKCCGQSRKALVLSDIGKRRLSSLRARRVLKRSGL